MPISNCKGTIYVIGGKEWCVGEKKMSKKYGTRKNNSKKSKKKTRSATKKRG